MRAAENIRLAIRPVAPTCRDQDRVSLRRWRGIERFFYMGLADLFFLGFNDSKYRSRPQNQFIDRHFIEPGGFAKSFEHGRQRQARTRIAANNHALFLMVLRPKKELYRSWQHIVRHPMMIEWHRQFDKFHKPPRKVSRAFCRCSRGLSWLSRISTERIPQCASGRNLSLPGETFRHFAKESGRSWNFTTLGLVSLPPSVWNGVRVPVVDQRPLPFQPAFGLSTRPSSHLA